MTYYQKCKRYARILSSKWRTPLDLRCVQDDPRLWYAEIRPWWLRDWYIIASGRTRESACKHLWQILVEDYGVKEDEL